MIGDMFLIQLHESVWPFAGVDVGPIILDEQGKLSEERKGTLVLLG